MGLLTVLIPFVIICERQWRKIMGKNALWVFNFVILLSRNTAALLKTTNFHCSFLTQLEKLQPLHLSREPWTTCYSRVHPPQSLFILCSFCWVPVLSAGIRKPHSKLLLWKHKAQRDWCLVSATWTMLLLHSITSKVISKSACIIHRVVICGGKQPECSRGVVLLKNRYLSNFFSLFNPLRYKSSDLIFTVLHTSPIRLDKEEKTISDSLLCDFIIFLCSREINLDPLSCN